MAKYKLLNEQGAIINIIEADAGYAASIGAVLWEAGDVLAPVAAPAESVPAPRRLTKLQYRRLFTQAERENCDEFAVTFEANPALTAEQRKTIRTGLTDYAVAEEIDLDDPDVLKMLQLYEALGLISAGRAAAIVG